jgi:LDH2 family malate/lactate/ureidoglycolate dehydrogenase
MSPAARASGRGASPSEAIRVPEGAARAWAHAVFRAAGMRSTDAEVVAHHLVVADLRGLYSHGLMRVPNYVKRLETGVTSATAWPAIVADHQAVAIVDGMNAMGQVVGEFAMDLAIDRAREHGTSFVVVRGSNHYGTCAHFVQMAVERGMIGLTGTMGAKNIMAPWGGASPLLGNNPFGVGIPAGRHDPVILDMALSVVAGGKILLAAKTGQEIPPDWAYDRHGRPTTDAVEAWEHLMVRPVGDYKGYAMAFVVALLSALLSDAALGADVKDLHEDFSNPQNVGHYMQAIDIRRFRDLGTFGRAVDAAIDAMHEAPRAPGVIEILVPGEPEARLAREQRTRGIAYDRHVLAELDEVGGRLGIGDLAEIAREDVAAGAGAADDPAQRAGAEIDGTP